MNSQLDEYQSRRDVRPRIAPEVVGEGRDEYEHPRQAPRGFLAFVGRASGVFAGAVMLAIVMVVLIIVLALGR